MGSVRKKAPATSRRRPLPAVVAEGAPAHRTMGAADFKARCLEVLDDVAAGGIPVIITKRGKPVARLLPVSTKAPHRLRGLWAGRGTIEGDLLDLGMTDDWEMLE